MRSAHPVVIATLRLENQPKGNRPAESGALYLLDLSAHVQPLPVLCTRRPRTAAVHRREANGTQIHVGERNVAGRGVSLNETA